MDAASMRSNNEFAKLAERHAVQLLPDATVRVLQPAHELLGQLGERTGGWALPKVPVRERAWDNTIAAAFARL
jgi:hypothetical protein